MKLGTYVTEVSKDFNVEIPNELVKRIDLNPGDKVEILVKKIKSGRKKGPVQEVSLLDILKIGKDET